MDTNWKHLTKHHNNHFHGNIKNISSVRSQNLVTLIFTKMTFCQRGNTKRMVHILSNSRISRPIRTPLKSINHALKYRIFEKFHYFGAHFSFEIQGFAMKKILKMSLLDGFSRKNGQNDVTQVKLSVMTVKSLLEVQNTNNSEFGCYLIQSCLTFSNIGHS